MENTNPIHIQLRTILENTTGAYSFFHFLVLKNYKDKGVKGYKGYKGAGKIRRMN